MTRGPGTKEAKAATRKGPLAKKRPSHTVDICLDDDVQRAYDEAKEAKEAAERSHDRLVAFGRAEDVAKSLERLLSLTETFEAAEVALEEATWHVRMVGMPREAYWEARALPEHKPTDEQIKGHNERMEAEGHFEGASPARLRELALTTNPDTWPRYLVSQCIEPSLSEEELDAIFDPRRPEFSETDVTMIYRAAEVACGKTSILRR